MLLPILCVILFPHQVSGFMLMPLRKSSQLFRVILPLHVVTFCLFEFGQQHFPSFFFVTDGIPFFPNCTQVFQEFLFMDLLVIVVSISFIHIGYL